MLKVQQTLCLPLLIWFMDWELGELVRGGFAAWKQVSPSGVDDCCEFVGVESENYS